MLKPDKWQAASDGEGKVFGFHKVLKLIILGGVDPSIRPEVWEFLLGCYALNSTAEYRRKLRTARRQRYEELIKHCQKMHSNIGTGSLAYVVGSKVMDARTSKEDGRCKAEAQRIEASDNCGSQYSYWNKSNNLTNTHKCRRERSSDSSDLISVRESMKAAAHDSSCIIPGDTKYSCCSLKPRGQAHESHCDFDNFFDFPALPVTDLFARSGELENQYISDDSRNSTQHHLCFNDETMHTFQINNNVDLVIASKSSMSDDLNSRNMEIHLEQNDHPEQRLQSTLKYKSKIVRRLRISDVPETEAMRTRTSQVEVTEDRVSEWLWTLHRIVVDVVRTDSHLHFYEDQKNLARMSDILAVYAWVDPVTGYCQGMSDLLSPFVVLYEDDADAFWCFEMLLRRTRENFRMEGETGVMKQLQTLWHILELTDREMFTHLSKIGAGSLHFAFRMLLVLFRRELSFSEALCMWEMMWAADFDDSMARKLDSMCLEPLMLQLPGDSVTDTGNERKEIDDGCWKAGPQGIQATTECSLDADIRSAGLNHSFCGLTQSFWSRTGRTRTRTSYIKNGEDGLPVFCVAAIIILNCHKIIRAANSIDDLIKIFNDNLLKIKVKRCIRTAIKLRRKYAYKLNKSSTSPCWDDDAD